MIEARIVIVGCGPVGALMANYLGERGIETLVLERDREIFKLPRAVGMDDEIMRALQAAGLDAAYRENVYTLRGMDLLRGNRRRLRRLSLEGEQQTLGHSIFTLFHQPTLESHIRNGLERYPDHVDLRLGEEVRAIRDGNDFVELDFVNRESGRHETVRAQYVLGCDGGRSHVRSTFGIEQHDLGLHQPWVVVDAIMKRPIPVSGFAEQICDPARPGTFIPSPKPRNRWEFMVMPGDDPDKLTSPEFLKTLIRPWAAPEDYEVERAAVYTFHALITKKWRFGQSGRFLLLGDAAHQMPPFLGQGMCAGIRDAFNLAWKLDMVLRDYADADLLDTYESERAEHVRKVITLAVRIGKIIQSPSRFRSFVSNALMVLGERLHIDMQVRTVKTIPIGLGFNSKAHAPAETSRCPFPQPMVQWEDGSERRLDECLGNGFTLLTRDGAPADAEGDSLIDAYRVAPDGSPEHGGRTPVIVDIEGAIGEWMDANCCDAVLLRPDRQPFGLYRGQRARLSYIVEDLQTALRRDGGVRARADSKQAVGGNV